VSLARNTTSIMLFVERGTKCDDRQRETAGALQQKEIHGQAGSY
jgi:hypothetical protein